MSTTVRDNYLRTEVMTATPQKLQLMLIEAALRFGYQAQQAWSESREDAATEALVRCQQVVTELLCSLNPEGDPQLIRRVASVYLYIFRTLTTAQMQRDANRLTDALRVLEEERQTWRELCEKMGSQRTEEGSDGDGYSFEA